MARAALSPAFTGLSGSIGDLTIVQRPGGPIARAKVYRRTVRTPGQVASARRLTFVSQAWHALDDAAFEAWGEYARTQSWRNPGTGAIVTPRAYNLFAGLATKARQVNPSLPLAGFLPPARPFLGDGVTVVAQASRPANPEPAGAEAGATSGGLRFSADRANAPGVVTELLIQPLENARRKAYRDKYASRGFVAFDGAPVEVAVAPGAYACAYRFVRPETGQETALVELGVAVVPQDPQESASNDRQNG